MNARKKTANAFSDAADVLSGSGIDTLFAQSDAPEFLVDLDEIDVVDQIRTQMEDDEQDLIGLGESLAEYQIQAILLRIMPADHPKPYRLVAGERRYRAARLVGLTQLRAKAREMTDDEAEDLQWAENIHRKNLTQIEEAGKVQRDLDRLGSIEDVLKKYGKSRAWLSKTLALLHLPEQAKRLVAENVSADLEVIGTVRTVEKTDPEAARALVDNLKATRGKSNARELANAAKEKVRPSKPKPAPKGPRPEEPTGENGRRITINDVLDEIYLDIFERGCVPETVLTRMGVEDREAVDMYLRAFFDAGMETKDVGRAVLHGLRTGRFSVTGERALALVVFLKGAADSAAKYDLLDALDSVTA
jgi:ParB family chromosome partitioning protein